MTATTLPTLAPLLLVAAVWLAAHVAHHCWWARHQRRLRDEIERLRDAGRGDP